jgi:hypothetical protein
METAPPLTLPLSVFVSYAAKPKDEALFEEFEAHLSLLKNQGVIAPWHHRKTLAGEDWQQTRNRYLETAYLPLRVAFFEIVWRALLADNANSQNSSI